MAIKNFIEELEWRGMIHTIMPGAKEQLEKEMTTAYLGIDPTADSLHIGHLVGVMILKHFQMCGHRPIALVGGATGMIGDPSGKSQERNLLDEETLRRNQEAIKRQLAKLIDVIKVVNLDDAPFVSYELAMIKVHCPTPQLRGELTNIAQLFNAKIVDVQPQSLVLRLTGREDHIEALLEMLGDYKIIEIARTGQIALSRGVVPVKEM